MFATSGARRRRKAAARQFAGVFVVAGVLPVVDIFNILYRQRVELIKPVDGELKAILVRIAHRSFPRRRMARAS
jgi:hypothetical protein